MFKQEEIDHLLSELEALSGTRPLFYLKFCAKEEYAQDILDGKYYANTPAFFRQREIESGERGQGDRNELILTLKVESVSAYACDTGDLAFTFPSGMASIQYKDDANIPMVSFVGIPLRDMKFINADEHHAEFDFPFAKEEFSSMQEKFGAYCVLIGARGLEEQIRKACACEGVDYIFDAVQYVPSNSLEEMKAYQAGSKERFLYKDKDLAYQREYRLAMAIEMPDDHYINIGKLQNARVLESTALEKLRFSIEYTSHHREEE